MTGSTRNRAAILRRPREKQGSNFLCHDAPEILHHTPISFDGKDRLNTMTVSLRVTEPVYKVISTRMSAEGRARLGDVIPVIVEQCHSADIFIKLPFNMPQATIIRGCFRSQMYFSHLNNDLNL